MYEIDASTIMLIGIDNENTKVITTEDEFIINESSKNIINNSCGYFGGSLKEKINMSIRLCGFKSKTPIIIEETRNIIFFPLKSTREHNNIWISFNNLNKYVKNNKKTDIYFKCGKVISIDFSYYIIDNQVTRALMLDYINNKRRKSL